MLKKFPVGGWCGRVIIVSALSLSLRDKERLRDRKSLTIIFSQSKTISINLPFCKNKQQHHNDPYSCCHWLLEDFPCFPRPRVATKIQNR